VVVLLEGVNDLNTMDPGLEREVQAMATVRIVLGGIFLLAPGLLLRLWLGREASTPFSRMMARSAGGRDLALGIGTLFALQHRAPVRGWLEASALADASDTFAVLAASGHVSRARRLLAGVPSVAALGYGRSLISRIAAEAPTNAAGMP
jgi:hypothetical protein